MQTILVAQKLSKRYGQRVGVADVDLEVQQGQLFGFLGPNGAGKTTTIRLLLGLVRPTSGSCSIFGLDCWRASEQIKHEVGYLPGDLRLYPWMTATRALSVFGRVRGKDLQAEGRRLAERLQLELDLPVRKMSRGMRQKLGLILTIAPLPRLLILDEPTSGLDPLMQYELARMLRELANQGHTIFFSSHTLSEVEQLCHHVAIVRAGRIVADEGLESLRNRARRVVTIHFADAETATRVAAPDFLTVTDRNGHSWQGELIGDAQSLVHWAARQPIADIEIGKPELETVFQSYYRS